MLKADDNITIINLSNYYKWYRALNYSIKPYHKLSSNKAIYLWVMHSFIELFVYFPVIKWNPRH